MQLKILSRRILLLMVVLSGSTLFIALVFHFIPKGLVQGESGLIIESSSIFQKQEQASSGLPVRLKIPSINVDAHVEYMGLTSDGAMDVPKDPVNVSWFNLGPHPGENGSSVIAGHYGWKDDIPAVFGNLHKLRKGDEIYIEDKKGVIITFMVREIQTYSKDEDASDVFGSSDGKAHLNLITCAGVWNNVEKNRPDRLIVFTDKK